MESEEHRKYTVKYLSLIYDIVAGTFNNKKTTSKIWRLWSWYNIISNLTIFLTQILFVLNGVSQQDRSHFALGLLAPCVTIILQHQCGTFYKKWGELMEIVDTKFYALMSEKVLQDNERVNNLKSWYKQRYIWLFFIISFCLPNLVLAGRLLHFWNQDYIDFDNSLNYFYPVPGKQQINSFTIFFIINLLELTTLYTICICFISFVLWVLIIRSEISNQTVILQELMKGYSQIVYNTVANIQQYELTIDHMKSQRMRKFALQKSQNDKNICFEDFDKSMKTCIRYHQIVIRTIKTISPILNTYFSLSMVLLITIMIEMPTSVPMKKIYETTALSVECVFYAVISLGVLYTHCLIAQNFQNLNDTIAEEVYSLPWYELPPKYRKNVYIFLCQAQASITFRAFKTFPYSMCLLPRVLNFVYSNIVNLRAIQDKKKQY